jgi:cation:H+ antiporter
VGIGIGLLLALVSSWMIARACDGFEEAADYLGRNMTGGMKGATINAIGSSMPELCVTFIYLFLFQDTTGFAGGIGTTAGSAVFNAMVIPALVILATLWTVRNVRIQVSRGVVIRDGLTLLAAEFFLIFFLGETLEWYHGFFLMLIYCSYATWMLYQHRKNSNSSDVSESDDADDADDANKHPLTASKRLFALLRIDLESVIVGGRTLVTQNAATLLAASTAVIALACWGLVYSCEIIGQSLHMHGYFVAVIVAAAASSVPDTILSIKDAKKGNYDDAIANALGSNIFDICFALGAPLFLYTLINGPLSIGPSIMSHIIELRLLLFLLTVIAFILFVCSKQFTRRTALSLMSLYGLFVLFVIGRAYDFTPATLVAEKLHLIQQFLQ